MKISTKKISMKTKPSLWGRNEKKFKIEYTDTRTSAKNNIPRCLRLFSHNNISISFRKRSFLSEEAKACVSEFPYRFRKDLPLRKYVAWFCLPHRRSFVDTSNLKELMSRFKKKINLNSSKIEKPRSILTKSITKHNLVLVHSRTKFELDKSKFAPVKQFRANLKTNKNLKKSERLNRFWRNSLPKVLYRYIIFAWSVRMIAQILQKLELPQTFFKTLKIP